MLRTDNQNRQMWALINRLGLDKEQVEDFVYQYTNARTSSTKDMIIPECQAFINHLNNLVANAPVDPNFEKANKMRRKIISICYEMGWTNPRTGKIDMQKVNNFCTNRTFDHKPLNDYTISELPKLVTQFEKVLKSFYDAKK
jgi:hypothetical protein